MANCDSDIIHQDENICILNPRLNRGVELIHTVGYMDPMEGISWYKLMNIVKETGLKSSGQLLLEKGKKSLPRSYKEARNSPNNNILGRASYMKYDPQTLSRIFFRPPMSAPFTLAEDGMTIVSAGQWEDFIGHPREDRLFFGGRPYSTLAEAGASSSTVGQGIVTIRVDPTQTYVFYEAMKSLSNIDPETGMSMPESFQTPEKASERYRQSRILLKDYLDTLQSKPGSLQDSYEVIATIPNLPPCAFAKIIYTGDKSHDGPEQPEDMIFRRQAKERAEAHKAKGQAMNKQVYNILRQLEVKSFQLSEAVREMRVQTASPLKTLSKKRERLEPAYNRVKILVNEFKQLLDNTGATEPLHPLQEEKLRERKMDFIKNYEFALRYIPEAEAMLATLPAPVVVAPRNNGAAAEEGTRRSTRVRKGGARKTRSMRNRRRRSHTRKGRKF